MWIVILKILTIIFSTRLRSKTQTQIVHFDERIFRHEAIPWHVYGDGADLPTRHLEVPSLRLENAVDGLRRKRKRDVTSSIVSCVTPFRREIFWHSCRANDVEIASPPDAYKSQEFCFHFVCSFSPVCFCFDREENCVFFPEHDYHSIQAFHDNKQPIISQYPTSSTIDLLSRRSITLSAQCIFRFILDSDQGHQLCRYSRRDPYDYKATVSWRSFRGACWNDIDGDSSFVSCFMVAREESSCESIVQFFTYRKARVARQVPGDKAWNKEKYFNLKIKYVFTSISSPHFYVYFCANRNERTTNWTKFFPVFIAM